MQMIVITVSVVVIVLLVVLTITPLLIVSYANLKLAHVGGYCIHFVRMNTRWIRGRILVYDITAQPDHPAPINTTTSLHVHIPVAIIRISWSSLLKGKLKLNVTLRNASINFRHHTELSTEPLTQQYAALQTKLMNIKPFDIDIVLDDARLRYANNRLPSNSPIVLSRLSVRLKDFSNVLPVKNAHLSANCSVFDGQLEASSAITPMADHPSFIVKIQLVNGKPTCLNPFLRKFLKLDIHAGTFALKTEWVAEAGMLQGYVEPEVNRVAMIGPGDKHHGVWRRIRERAISGVIFLVSKGPERSISLRLPFKGTLDSVEISYATIIIMLARNIAAKISGMQRILY